MVYLDMVYLEEICIMSNLGGREGGIPVSRVSMPSYVLSMLFICLKSKTTQTIEEGGFENFNVQVPPV